MRAPFQILALPYRMNGEEPLYCIFRRADFDQWQFISGGGEDTETPMEAAIREILEEGSILVCEITALTSLAYIPSLVFPKRHLYGWPDDTFVVPEYAFAFACTDEIHLSHEHTEYAWLPYEAACEKLRWDSNRTALYELHCRLTGFSINQ